MDVPPGSGEFDESNELDRLRRRAYGPGADIAGDAAAQARLAELEAAQRRQPAPIGEAAASAPDPIPERVPVLGSGHGSRSDSASSPQPEDGASAEHESAGSKTIDGAPAAPWWRGRRWFAILGGAIAALAVIAALVAWMSPRAPEYVLTPDYAFPPDFVLALKSDSVDADEPKDPHGTLDRLGLDADEMRRYEDYGYLSVWSGESRYGTTCLLVAHPVQGLNEGIGAEACSADDLDTIADLMQTTGSLTRFVLKSDHVVVYEYLRAAEPSAPEG
ncbi:hypothetical protein [Cryobacterium sp. N22]|uniref:hypothetical protein n=1 Tax=Cryobacterium sp. N22 TaxID=2048290 RepID=UPI000CE3D841|nr:hypothetical protein [Cryobacterium sp. N22]